METKLYNLDILKITTEDDNEFLVKILSTFLNNNKEMIVKLEDAFEGKRLVEIGDIAHKMLGSYKHLEINSLIQPLTELEGLTLGKKINSDHIKDLIEHIKLDSNEVFQGLEREISEINNL